MVASPLSQFLRSGGTSTLSGSPLAGLSGGRAGARGIEAWLGGPEVDPAMEMLERNRTSYDNRQAEAIAYGQDPDGKAPQGLWSSLVGYLDAPGAAVRGGLSGLAGIDFEGDEVDGNNLGVAASRFLAGLNPRDRTGVEEGGSQFGVGQWGNLQFSEDAGLLEKFAKGAAALGGDIALDPLTYVTAGGAAVGKRAAVEMVEAGGRNFAKNNLSGEALEKFAKRSQPERTTQFLRESLGENHPSVVSFAERNLARPSTVADDQTWRRMLGESTFGAEAAQAHLAGGRTGLARWAREELGDEAGEQFMRSLPTDVQGGINLRVPLLRRPVEGGRAPVSAGVARGALDDMGLGDLAIKGTEARNRLRATKLGQSVSTKLSGTEGALYGKVVRDMVDGLSDQPGGHSYAMYAAKKAAARRDTIRAQEIQGATLETVTAMGRFTDSAADPEAAKQTMQEMFNNPARLRELRTQVSREPTTGQIVGVSEHADPAAPAVLTAMSDSERAGVTAALLGMEYLENMHRQLLAHGVDVGHIQDYVPIIMSEQARGLRQQARKAGRSGKGGVGGYDPSRTAQQFWMPADIAEDGTINSWRRLTPSQINERQTAREAEGVAQRVGDEFIEDPAQILATYGDAVRRMVGRVEFQNTLREAGVVVDGGTDTIRRVVSSQVRDAQQAAAGSAQAWRQAIEEVGATAPEAAAGRQPLREAFEQTFADVPDTATAGLWDDIFGDAARVVVPEGPIEARVLATLRRAGWRPDGQEGGRPVYRPPSVDAEDLTPEDLLTRQVDEIMLDQQNFDRAVTSLLDGPMEHQLENIDVVMDQLADFQSRHVEALRRLRPDGPDNPDMGDVWSSKIKEAQARYRQTNEARQGVVTTDTSTWDDATQFLLQETDMRQLGAQHGVAARPGRAAQTTGAANDVNLPPELDSALAPEWMAQAAEKFYQAAGPRNKEFERFFNGVYRPYLNFFKTTATVGRGYGYDARNIMGGLNNNWIAGIGVDAHKDAAALRLAIHRANSRAKKQEIDRVMQATGRSRKEAKATVDGVAIETRAEELLREALEGKTTHQGVPLYEVHRGMRDNQVAMSNRLEMGLGDAVRQGQIVDFSRGRADINLFAGSDPADLNRLQQRTNQFMGLEWFRHKARVAESSEQFIRGAAYIEGLHRYGRADGGESAGLLAKALHFDYDDLSDWERVWMQGFAVPFWTWTRNNVPLQLRGLAKNPGLFNRMRMTNDQARAIMGEDDDYDIVPEWMQERLGWRSRFRSQDGHPLVIGVEGSAVDLNQWIKVGRPGEVARSSARQVVNSMSPVIGTPAEALLGVNTFTGAPHNPRGVELPGWARIMQLDKIPGQGWTDDEGLRRTRQMPVDAIESILPPLGLAERLLVGPAVGMVSGDGSGDRSLERVGTSWAANMAAAPVATLTPRQEAGELRGRIERLQQRTRWADAPPEQRAHIEALLERGVPPEIVHQIVFGDGL